MSCACGCCTGIHAITPQFVANRPGLGQIGTRIGTHASFLETMCARLSSSDYPELAALRTRDPSDPVIALLNGWATIADVLSFYQERIANEGYLRTATERRSLIELARLIGYTPRPGLAASVHLAFGVDKESAPVTIPKGTKANSVPNPGETMEAFETSADILARAEWSAIRPRLVQPQTARSIDAGLYLKGTETRLAAGDLLLIDRDGSGRHEAATVAAVTPNHDRGWTLVTLQPRKPAAPPPDLSAVPSGDTLEALRRAPSRPPIGSAQLPRSLAASFAAHADAALRLVTQVDPLLKANLYPALRNAAPIVAQPIEVLALRVAARLFGNSAPPKLMRISDAVPQFGEWQIGDAKGLYGPKLLALDGDFEVAAGTKVVIARPDKDPLVLETASLRHGSHTGYGLSGKSLSLSWDGDAWLGAREAFQIVRDTRVYLGSERLSLADAPITEAVSGGSIELDGLYDGLEPGRWLIVEGERTDIPDRQGRPIPGIRGAELLMLAGIIQGLKDDEAGPIRAGPDSATDGDGDGRRPRPLPGDTYHSTVLFAADHGLAYRYRRDSVTIYANVAAATHGETRTETLGSGDAALALQQFQLKQFPLTYVSARTPDGVASTLETRIDAVLWYERPTLAVAGPSDRSYATRVGDDDKTILTFGNGRRGARLPTGRENVKAVFRSGLGKRGNAAARQVSLLSSRPLGVKDVINPIRASGGTDREGPEAIRGNASIALLALDRLLSTTDYAAFARNFAGVGKAAARRDGRGVTVVIAGVDDAPIDVSSDLYVNLKSALHRSGDAAVPITLAIRSRLSLIVQAGVRIDPDYLWEAVEPKVRAALLDRFAFDRREFGAPAFLAEAFRAIQSVKGVLSSDVSVFNAVGEELLLAGDQGLAADTLVALQRVSAAADQIIWLSPAVADTLILQELPS